MPRLSIMRLFRGAVVSIFTFRLLQTNPEALEAAMDLPQASVRQRASRVLQLLGIGGAVPSGGGAGSKTQAQPQPDLLGGLTDEADTTQQSQPEATSDILGDCLHHLVLVNHCYILSIKCMALERPGGLLQASKDGSCLVNLQASPMIAVSRIALTIALIAFVR